MMIDDYDESSGWMFFWYRLTRVFPDKFHRAVKRLLLLLFQGPGKSWKWVWSWKEPEI